MGSARRPRPVRLAIKLREVRVKLDLTQEQMLEKLGKAKVSLKPGHISEYESGKREPPLPVLLRYARLAGVPMEMLVDDKLDLPEHLPVMSGRYEWVMKSVRPKRKH
jgi:transcriptional regulator with XRE-family HTH domain